MVMHRRESSSSTVRLANDHLNSTKLDPTDHIAIPLSIKATLWVHDDTFSPHQVLICPSILSGSTVHDGDLLEIIPYVDSVEVRDFEREAHSHEDAGDDSVSELDLDDVSNTSSSRFLCIAKVASPDLMDKHKDLEVSMTRTVANAFGFRPRSQVTLTKSEYNKWTASHVELGFRDAYLARSDMWRLVTQELAGRTLYKGQKMSFLGSMKVTVKSIHIRGHHVSTCYFSRTTIPVFRSEAARYVLFIQMSREMWDFDSEGNGEIMFNRVINGFLPDLFRRWVTLEVRHLVSIVMFGRLEYDRYDFSNTNTTSGGGLSQSSSVSNVGTGYYQDFYRVVVTDMASAQWTTILDELKKDFRVFLRDMSLHVPEIPSYTSQASALPPKITGRPSTALKGNILEAINIASSQFANDYIDRDLIRTGVSTIVITAGTGVFEVDRDLLYLTSENLTNNGIGIDIVCLSKMPLHSVPLFKYRLPQSTNISRASSHVSPSPRTVSTGVGFPSLSSVGQSSAYSSFTSSSANFFLRYPSAFSSRSYQNYGYGVPQWIDLSYWSPESDLVGSTLHRRFSSKTGKYHIHTKREFVPRVRMYELQMMGLMELGMADIAIPYLSETGLRQQKKRRRIRSDLGHLPSTRSLSQSPTLTRKVKPQMPRHKGSEGILASQAKNLGPTFDSMDDYDAWTFRSVHVSQNNPKRNLSKQGSKLHMSSKTTSSSNVKPQDVPQQHHSSLSKELASSLIQPLYDAKRESSDTASMNASTLISTPPNSTSSTTARPARISRSISYALRGLAPPVRTAPTLKVNAETVRAQPLLAKTSLTQAVATAPSYSGRAESVLSSDVDQDSHHGVENDNHSILSSDTIGEKPTKPILIGGLGVQSSETREGLKLRAPGRTTSRETGRGDFSQHRSRSISPSSSEDTTSEMLSLDLMPSSIPRSTLPFIRNVNASNPLKKHPKAASVFGRWQHLYPHKPRSSIVKWRSLCTPASVPLTTEDFPSLKDLETEYDQKTHRVYPAAFTDLLEEPLTVNTLLQEMISLRLAHGYQVVTGDSISRMFGKDLCDSTAFLDPKNLCNNGGYMFMCMGNTVQKLAFQDSDGVYVTKYVHKGPQTEQSFPKSFHYAPNIRTILSKEYKPRPMQLSGVLEEYPWEVADNYLAAGGLGQDEKVDELRFWRARFVLLPVEPPVGASRPPQQQSEDNDEEIHLLGIRALTQMWQKARFFTQNERKVTHGRMGTVRRKDQNPLEIKYETLNPSEVVATELDKLLALEESGEVSMTQLLPETERLDRETSMAKLAHAIQGDKGIEIKNRRWHLRLHYNCFHGEEFTNWLSQNVKNIETREEAVEFGNQLMKEGLFEHVNGRHNFKDGNYFYSLKADFRAPRLDLKGPWYTAGRRPDRSIPPTPLSEHPSREQAPISTRSRSGSSLAYQLNPSTPLEPSRSPFEKKKKTVSLSKMIKIDVDPRKRSNRGEIVNLHYDRLHNPENCYHIELSWLNVTSKLVDDAIISWTTQAEKYGLKLVEVPIAEASEVPKQEPFRSVYRIKLASEPPKRVVFTNVFTTSSFTPQANLTPDVHLYQKALLKRFNFVLDLEAASEYPENVDIQYSWGRLNYQYTQFIHRSGIVLAQITSEGDILLLANRLYNSRFASNKEAAIKFDPRRERENGPLPHRAVVPPSSSITTNSGSNNASTGTSTANATTSTTIPSMQASGLIGLNMQSPSLSPFSPQVRASADVLGSKPALSSSALAQYVTPEQIKDDLEAICHDAAKLDAFYREVNSVAGSAAPGSVASGSGGRRAGSTGSSMLRPIREPFIPGLSPREGKGSGNGTGEEDAEEADAGIPVFELPESVTGPPSAIVTGMSGGPSGSLGVNTGSIGGSGGGGGINLGFGILRRARGSVMYDSVAEMFGGGASGGGGSKDRDRNGGNGSKSGSVDGNGDASGSLSAQRSHGERRMADDIPKSPAGILSGLNSPKRKSTVP